MKVVVTSDQHLGYANSDKSAFHEFLDTLSQESDVTDLILLGDVVDMWRRDASGVFLDHHDTIAKILSLKSKGVNIFYVAGNHDYHVLNLVNPTYPIKFSKEVNLTDGNVNYRFVHGYEFDSEQRVTMMAFLCRVMSDRGGVVEGEIWTDLGNWKSALSKLEPAFLKTDLAAVAQRLHQRPEDRLKGSLHKINAAAFNAVKPGEILVFGHTHAPFVNKAENVVNSGSWVKDSAIHNTYVEFSGGKPRLFVFGGEEITERI